MGFVHHVHDGLVDYAYKNRIALVMLVVVGAGYALYTSNELGNRNSLLNLRMQTHSHPHSHSVRDDSPFTTENRTPAEMPAPYEYVGGFF